MSIFRRLLMYAKFSIKYGLNGVREKIRFKNARIEFDRRHSYVNTLPGEVEGDIKFSIIMPVYNVEIKWLREAIHSIQNQVYANWELCIADDCSTDNALHEFLCEVDAWEKVSVVFSEINGGISSTTNLAAKKATGEYLVFMDNDDIISRDALLEIFYKVSKTDADVIYSDQDQVSVKGKHFNPLYKPDWSYDLLTSCMYVGHLLCVRSELFKELGGFNSEFDGSQDYDLMLRLSENTSSIEHIDKVLYSWRDLPSSTSSNPNAKPFAQTSGYRALQSHIDRKYGRLSGVEVRALDFAFCYDFKYPIKRDTFISIIIPTKDHCDDLKKVIDSILSQKSNIPFEIIVLNNQSVENNTFQYFNSFESDATVRVINADYPFNWSKLNNHGIKEARGNVLICLNNDVIINSPDWLERLAGDAQRDEVGVAGPLLLYPDGTIQHAGVVVGMSGWADHVFKCMKPTHFISPFISPMVKRNVTAVTGACMAFTRDVYDVIGGFDEEFIVCGSDVDFCLSALKHGYSNLYDPSVSMIHYESKTRDAKEVPEVDFRKSKESYAYYLDKGDPFFNDNLDYMRQEPSVAKCLRKSITKINEFEINEIRPVKFRKCNISKTRINLMIPSINREDIYGGISTAVRFFMQLGDLLKCDMRIVILTSRPNQKSLPQEFSSFEMVNANNDSLKPRQIVSLVDRDNSTLGVSSNDIFIFTIWWSAYCIQNEYMIRAKDGFAPNPFIYLIQDFEPGFYPWSSRYALAESTYKTALPHIAIFNSELLKQYFDIHKYKFEKTFSFNPILNPKLKEYLDLLPSNLIKRKQILVYGRPNTDRNAFELIAAALREWIQDFDGSVGWKIVAAGENFDPVYLGRGIEIEPLGKLSLQKYAEVLAESAIGISLMISPHPSYPPLEMAAFGMNVISNKYANKDLGEFSKYIYSVENCTPHEIAIALTKYTQEFTGRSTKGLVDDTYMHSTKEEFEFMHDLIEWII